LSATFLVTGGTGFIGSHVAAELLRRGQNVVLLARPRGRMTAHERVDRLFDWFGFAPLERRRLAVVEGQLDEPGLGIERSRYEELVASIDEIVHCASSTSFSERKRAEIVRANVTNLGAVLDLASSGGCSFFHHVSTAYAAGRREGPCPEELAEAREFANVYEETKHRGEVIVAERCASEGIGLNIYRPSIVYGDSRTGRTIRFDGVYYPVKAVSFFKNLYERDMAEHAGRRAREMGISIDGRGRMNLPIRVLASSSGGVNLIPIDFFVSAFMAIMDEGPAGGVFHIVNPRLTTIDELAAWTGDFFNVSGLRSVGPEEFAAAPRSPLELLFERSIEAYTPYLNDTRLFQNALTAAVLEKRGIECPAFDEPMFSRCMRYAIEVDWGARLLPEAEEGR
jgi:nucleoside-diphosphate-sugar epimerase